MTLVVLEIEQKRPVTNSSQNGSRDPQFCMKIDLALLIPMIYITHIIQKWHLEQNGSQVTKSLINERCHCIRHCTRMSCIIWERGDFILSDEIPISTIELSDGRFKAYNHISLPKVLIWESRRSQNKAYIQEQALAYRLSCEINTPWAGGILRRWTIAA